jgi:voltage-gated potassium channel
MIIFIGVGLLSVITATISSILVERKMKEGKGLEDIKLRNHIIICGWNFVAGKILEGLALASESSHRSREKIDMVLVNDLEEDKANDIIYSYSGLSIKFVKGSFTSEAVLKRANVGRANSVIILADTTSGRTADQADERTVIGAFAVKNLAPNVKTYAEIYNPENSQHLKRAGVNETIISGEYSGFLLASAALSPGIPKVIKELLAFSTGSDLLSLDIPRRFVGKTFKELSDYFRAEHKAILVAIMSEKKSMVLDDILAGDASSAIDVFIKRKFEESGEDYFAAREGEVEVNLNPGDDYKINEGEQAIIITKRKTAT